MSNLSINISAGDLQSTGNYEPLPDGSYESTVYAVELTEVKNGENAGKPQYKLQFRVSEGQFENRRIFTYIPLYTGKAFWKTQAFFSALGYEMADGKFVVPTPTDLSGKPVRINLSIVENNNGEKENNVKGFAKTQVKVGAAALLGAGAVEADDTW